MSPSIPSPLPRRFGTFEQLAKQEGTSERTVRNQAGKGYFPVYKRPGTRGYLVDLDEAAEALAKLPPTAVRRGFGTLGPEAKIVNLPARAEIVRPTDGGDR
ncbi:hypothetical protein [Agromyces sp. ZXT2-3]|uniref:hypothetical protein n=1 Tax=Agromyces sp. ZXT2-3 TaxID=3461152 RepID=UPI004054DFE0